jgi:WD40 repeat protein
MNLKSSFINNLIDTYCFEKNLNNYNYEIIENLKNIRKIKLTNENIKNFNVLNSKIYNKLTYHKDAINQIILLKNGRIASSANDKSILIYDKEMNNIQLSINNNLKSNVLNIMQSNEGYIFASLDSGSILIYKLNSSNSYQLIQDIKGHDDRVTKIIQIKDGRFISCSNDKTIKIWKFLNEQLILDETLNEYEETGISSIIEFKENEIISTPYKVGSIVFWSLQELKIIEKINNIKCDWDWNIIEKINEDTIIVGGRKSLYLIKNYKLVIDIKMDSNYYCICYLSNGYILTGHKNGNIKEWKLINNELKLIGEKNLHVK